jgi:hypothetical protein
MEVNFIESHISLSLSLSLSLILFPFSFFLYSQDGKEKELLSRFNGES